METCCERFAHETYEFQPPVGDGMLYPPGMRPTGQIERIGDNNWAINGCCGGGCYVIREMKFCPFCGTKLP